VQYISESYCEDERNRINIHDGSQSSEVSQYFRKNSDLLDEAVEEYSLVNDANSTDYRIRILDEAKRTAYERKAPLEEPSISKQVILEHQ